MPVRFGACKRLIDPIEVKSETLPLHKLAALSMIRSLPSKSLKLRSINCSRWKWWWWCEGIVQHDGRSKNFTLRCTVNECVCNREDDSVIVEWCTFTSSSRLFNLIGLSNCHLLFFYSDRMFLNREYTSTWCQLRCRSSIVPFIHTLFWRAISAPLHFSPGRQLLQHYKMMAS